MGKEWKEKEREREDRERKAGITTSRTRECHEEAGLHSAAEPAHSERHGSTGTAAVRGHGETGQV